MSISRALLRRAGEGPHPRPTRTRHEGAPTTSANRPDAPPTNRWPALLLVGGVLTQALDWHWIFIVNVPIGLATAVATRRLIAHDTGAGLRGGADVPGAVLVTGALMRSRAEARRARRR